MLNFDWLNSLDLGLAKFMVLLAFIIPLVLSWFMPRRYIYQGAMDQKPWRNLKLWILLLVVIQVTIYLIF